MSDRVDAYAQALLLVGAVLIDAAATPTTDLGLFVTVGYTLLLTAPVSMFVYLVLGWSALTLSDWRSRAPPAATPPGWHG